MRASGAGYDTERRNQSMKEGHKIMKLDRSLTIQNIPYLYILLLSLLFGFFACDKFKPQENDIFWTADNSPDKIGKMIINNLLNRPELMMYVTDFWTGVHYAEAR